MDTAWRLAPSGAAAAALELDKQQAPACSGEAFVREGSLSRASSVTALGAGIFFAAPACPEECEAQSPFVNASFDLAGRGRDGVPAAAPFASAAASDAPLPLDFSTAPALPPNEHWFALVSHQRAREVELAPSAHYLEERHAAAAPHADAVDQSLSPEMRVIVTSWLAEVADEFGLQQETLHLAVALLDRFLSATTAVPRGALQLLAVACVMVAAKDLEVAALSVQQLTSVAAGSFSADDLRRMERIVLDALDFRVASPTAHTFAHLLGLGAGAGAAARADAFYLAELALLDYGTLQHRPSEVGAAALLIALNGAGGNAAAAAAGRVLALSGAAPARVAAAADALLVLQRAAAVPATQAAADLFAPVRARHGAAASAAAGALLPPLA